MIDSFFVFHPEPVPGMSCDLAGSEVLGQETGGVPQNYQGIRGWIAETSRPERVDAADDGREPEFGTEEVDGTRFAIVCRQDSYMRPLIRGKSVADLSNGFDQLRPTDFFDIITLNFAGNVPPFRMDRSEGQGQHGSHHDVRTQDEQRNGTEHGGPAAVQRGQRTLSPNPSPGITHRIHPAQQ